MKLVLVINVVVLLLVSVSLLVSASRRFNKAYDLEKLEMMRRGRASGDEYNYRPIIGVLTEDAEQNLRNRHADDEHVPSEYIASSYVKFLEGAGARVVAVRYKQDKDDLIELFGKLNGVLLPGGGELIKPGNRFFRAGEALWEYLKEDPTFPVFGTCLGMEFLLALITGNDDVLTNSGKFNAHNATYNLKLRHHAYTSELFKGVLQNYKLYDALKYKNITYNEHVAGVTPSEFRKHEELDDFNILATSVDDNGVEFVAAMEHKYRNIFGIQFHPEKNIYEWFSKGNFPHSNEAVLFAQSLANVFVSKTRMNFNSFGLSPEEEAKVLIQNHHSAFGGDFYFQECYLFYEHEPQLGLESSLKQNQGQQTGLNQQHMLRYSSEETIES